MFLEEMDRDFEAPADANKDNIYEFLFTGATFSDLKLNKNLGVVIMLIGKTLQGQAILLSQFF